MSIAQCLASYFGDPVKFSMVFFVVFQASTGKKRRENNHGKILGPGSLMLNIPLMISTPYKISKMGNDFITYIEELRGNIFQVISFIFWV